MVKKTKGSKRMTNGISQEAITTGNSLAQDGPCSVDTLAVRTGLHSSVIQRALKELIAARVVGTDGQGNFGIIQQR